MVEESLFHLLDVALVNGYILYKGATESKKAQLHFRLTVAKSLIEGLQRPRHHHHLPAPELPLRLRDRAFPQPIPEEKRANCKVCSLRTAGQRHHTRYRCKLCHTLLCLYPCFERYHILKDHLVTRQTLPFILSVSPTLCIYVLTLCIYIVVP